MCASLGPGARCVIAAGAVAVDEAVLGAEHPAAVNRQSATANAMAAQIFIFKQLIKLAQLRPNIAWFVQKETLFARMVLIELQKLSCTFGPYYDNIRPKIEIMKTTALIVTFCLSAACLIGCGKKKSVPPPQGTIAPAVTNQLTDEKSHVSYAIGMMT